MTSSPPGPVLGHGPDGPRGKQAIAAIPEPAWATIKYPNAVWDEQEHRWISEAEVAGTGFIAFTSYPKNRQVTCRLIVHRIPRLRPAQAPGQLALFTLWRHHGFITNTTLSTVDADETHRDRAIIEQVIAELKNGPLAHAPAWTSPSQRRLARPDLHDVQPAARRGRRSLGPARESPLGNPADPTGHRPGPGRDLRPTTRAAPTQRLALGPPPGKTSGPPPRPDHPGPTAPRNDPTWKSRTDRPIHHAYPTASSKIIRRHRHLQSPETASVDQG